MFNRRLTRRSFLVMAGTCGAATLVAACGTPAASPSPAAKQAEQAPAPTQASAATKPTAPAAQQAAPTAGPAPELIYLYGLREIPKDLGLVETEANKILMEQINATISLQPIEFGAYNDKLLAKNAAGEKYDLAFTAGWINNYHDNVKNGVLLDLTDLLPRLAPNFYKNLNPASWDAVKVKGAVYAAINQQIWASVTGVLARKDMAEKYDLDLTTVERLENLEPWLSALVKGEDEKVTPVVSDDSGHGTLWWSTLWDVDSLPGGAYVYMNDSERQARSQMTIPEYRTCMELTRRWYEAGYYSKEPIPQAEIEAAIKAGRYATKFHTMKPGVEAEEKATNGWDWVSKILDKGYLTTTAIIATLTGVNKKTSSPEACARYFELVNTDKPFYNLLCKGIEGKHWVWVDKDKEVIGFPSGITPQNSPYNPNVDWELGDQFNAYYVDVAQVGAWEATRKLNNAAKPSPILGFVPDKEPVKNELAAIDAATAEFKFMALGILDLAKAWPSLEGKLKSAGQDKVLAEWQRQIDEWKASA